MAGAMATLAITRRLPTVTVRPTGFQIEIPAARSRRAVAVSVFALTAWVAGELFLAVLLFTGRLEPVLVLGALAAVAWTAAGPAAIYLGLWGTVGKEVVSITDRGVTLRRAVFGFGPAVAFEGAQVRNLRFETRPGLWLEAVGAAFGQPVGRIAFESAAQTWRFGRCLSPDEAERIVRRIRERFLFDSGSPDGPASSDGSREGAD